MPRKFYTIFILPHAHARFRKIHVSRNFLLILIGLLVVAVAAGAATPHLFLAVRSRTQALETLQAENRKLKDENQRFEASLSQLGSQLNAFETGARRLAAAVGLKELPGLRAVGGSRSPAAAPSGGMQAMLEEELQAMRSRAGSLDRSLEEIHQKWEERLRLLASTPSVLPVSGSTSDGFGWRDDPFTGEPEYHKGVDIVAPAGTTVHATADGVVTRVGRESGYGKMVQLSHGFGLGSLYGHLGVILVRPGQRVRKGDPIGQVGSTGRSTGPHLHYEIFKGGHQVDPRKFLAEVRS